MKEDHRGRVLGSFPKTVTGVTIAAALILLISILFQSLNITREAMWVDEAESSINALSILENGYPTDQYLGIPIYENMLVRPWPDHPEYEFKDISYSDRGMAVYHGWLPLYAIAASFKLMGVEPAQATAGWQVGTDISVFIRHTVAARLPSLIFSAVFLILIFVVGRRFAGDEVALGVLVLTGLSSSVAAVTLQARYYSCSLALYAASALTLWQIVCRGNRRQFAVHTLVLICLFYTNMIGFLNMVVLTTIVLFVQKRSLKSFYYWIVGLLAIAVCTVPWVLATGFFQHLEHMPSGRMLVDFPGDFLTYLFNRIPYFTFFAVGTVWLFLAWLRHGRTLPDRLREPWERHRLQYMILLGWIGITTATYYLFMPPASLLPQRLSLMLFVPGFLFIAMTMADAIRTLTSFRWPFVTAVLAFTFLAAFGLLHLPGSKPHSFRNLGSTFEFLNELQLKPDAKVYASPSSNLVLMFYSGKPIQSLAPVRKSFLDNHPGEVLYIEEQFGWQFQAPRWYNVNSAAQRLGLSLSAPEVRALHDELETRFARERTALLVAQVIPDLEPLTPLEEEIMRQTRWQAEQLADRKESEWRNQAFLFAKGFRIRTSADLWQTFFYRLVDPVARQGSEFNAADRLRMGSAYFLPSANRVFFYSPPAVPALSASSR